MVEEYTFSEKYGEIVTSFESYKLVLLIIFFGKYNVIQKNKAAQIFNI
jgi:hypothetical protein